MVAIKRQKMGMTIQFESHHHELAGIYAMQYDSEVLEYYDQPPSIKLNYESASGRQVGVKHTPDFFEIGRRSAGWSEWKTTQELEQLAIKMPNRYQEIETGHWRSPPGESYAQDRGLEYLVRTEKEIDWNLQRNLYFLEDYFRDKIKQSLPLSNQQKISSSPRDKSIIQTGLRPSRLISYDETFRILTMPTTKKGTARVIPNQGVKINHLYYWHNSFRNGSIKKTRVSVRYNPKDAGVAYAYVRKQWVRCISQYYSVFKGRSEREIQLATQELRQQYKQHSKRFTITAKALAVFLEGTEITESILMQRLKDGEVKDTNINEPISGQSSLSLVDVAEEKPQSVSAEIKPYEEFW